MLNAALEETRACQPHPLLPGLLPFDLTSPVRVPCCNFHPQLQPFFSMSFFFFLTRKSPNRALVPWEECGEGPIIVQGHSDVSTLIGAPVLKSPLCIRSWVALDPTPTSSSLGT